MRSLKRIVAILSAFLIIAGQAKAGDLPELCLEELMEEVYEFAPLEDNCSDVLLQFSFFESDEEPFDVVKKNPHRNHSAKKKKKLRNHSCFEIRSVVRSELSPPQSFIQYGYNKPHFLHQLHQFLFRLTPF